MDVMLRIKAWWGVILSKLIPLHRPGNHLAETDVVKSTPQTRPIGGRVNCFPRAILGYNLEELSVLNQDKPILNRADFSWTVNGKAWTTDSCYAYDDEYESLLAAWMDCTIELILFGGQEVHMVVDWGAETSSKFNEVFGIFPVDEITVRYTGRLELPLAQNSWACSNWVGQAIDQEAEWCFPVERWNDRNKKGLLAFLFQNQPDFIYRHSEYYDASSPDSFVVEQRFVWLT